MKANLTIFGLCILLISGCAQVPKESVELSATIGRDIAVTQKAHTQLATLYFAKMKDDVNRFIDEEYAPYQIRAAMMRQSALANSVEKEQKNKSLLLAINAAFKPDAPEELQKAVLKGMESLVTKIRNDVEKMRASLIDPLNEQEAIVLGSINRAYQQMHYANSIVTGHLSSVVKVHDTQAELLSEIGIEKDLRKVVGDGLSTASTKISHLVNKADDANKKIDSAEKNANKLKEIIDDLGGVVKQNPEGSK